MATFLSLDACWYCDVALLGRSEVFSFFQGQDEMPGTKSRTKRRKKRWTYGPTPRKVPEGVSTLQSPVVPSAVASAPSTSTASPSTPRATTASKKKLSVSPYVFLDASDDSSSSSAEESEGELEGHGSRLFELEGLKSVGSKMWGVQREGISV